MFLLKISLEDVEPEPDPETKYPNTLVFNRVENFTAYGEVVYMLCRSGHFQNLKFGEYFTESRGICLITEVKATLISGDKEIHASSYQSSGTSYADFEIVRWRNVYNFCVRRVGTGCS